MKRRSAIGPSVYPLLIATAVLAGSCSDTGYFFTGRYESMQPLMEPRTVEITETETPGFYRVVLTRSRSAPAPSRIGRVTGLELVVPSRPGVPMGDELHFTRNGRYELRMHRVRPAGYLPEDIDQVFYLERK